MSNFTSTETSYALSTMEQYNSTTTTTNFVGTNASYSPAITREYNSTVIDTNFTNTNATHVHSEEEYSNIFIGLSRVEEVMVWAAVSVGILAVVAVILRLVMPLIRKKHRKSKDAAKDAIKGSSSHLLESGTPSSSSRASTISGEMEFWNINDNQKDLPTVSGSLERHHKQSAYGNLSTEVSSFPVYLPKMKVVSVEVDTSSQTRLNDELSSILNTPVLQRLTSLNLNEDYRRNWQTTFDSEFKLAEGLRHVTQPPDNRQLRVPVLIHQSSPKQEKASQPNKKISLRF